MLIKRDGGNWPDEVSATCQRVRCYIQQGNLNDEEKFLYAHSSLNREEFLFGKISGGVTMTKLEQLYAKQKQLEEQQVTGVAAAMQRYQRNSQLQKEIDYYELGDTISREEIQVELAEITRIQEEINRLTAVVDEKKRKLKASVFGEHTALL